MLNYMSKENVSMMCVFSNFRAVSSHVVKCIMHVILFSLQRNMTSDNLISWLFQTKAQMPLITIVSIRGNCFSRPTLSASKLFCTVWVRWHWKTYRNYGYMYRYLSQESSHEKYDTLKAELRTWHPESLWRKIHSSSQGNLSETPLPPSTFFL